MLATNKQEFIEYFKEIDDPRQDEKVLYPLHEVLFLILCGVLCCAEDWEAIVDFGITKLEVLKKYFPYEHGIPSISTLMRVIGLIETKCMERWLKHHAQRIASSLEEQFLAFDGKALRGKRKFGGQEKNTHTLNVFSTKLGLALAQKSIPDKGNEITAIQEIINESDLKGATVSIDAIGCQKQIAASIISKGGDYFLALKANQPSLLSDVEAMFDAKNTYFPEAYYEVDKGHGRIETRLCESLSNINWLTDRHPAWSNLKSIIKLTSTREIKNKISKNIKYYITSKKSDSKTNLDCARSHWSIENTLHWVLDVQFKEDDCLIRKNYAAENMAIVRKMILNIIRDYKKKTGKKGSINRHRHVSGWDDKRMHEIIESWVYSCS